MKALSSAEKNMLVKEAAKQTEALKRISSWRSMAVGVSTVGAALVYAGFIGGHHVALGLGGAMTLMLGLGAAVVLNLGLRNGRRNVEKILQAVHGEAAGGSAYEG